MLRGVLELAAAHGLDEHCWKLAWFWAPKLKRRGRMHEVLTVQRLALASADRLGDTDALAHVHYDLGHVERLARRLPGGRPAPAAGARAFHRARRPGRRRAGPARARPAAQPGRTVTPRPSSTPRGAATAPRVRRLGGGRLLGEHGRLDPRASRRARRGAACTAAARSSCTASRAAGPAWPTRWTASPSSTASSADYPRAIDHYEQALAMYRHIGDPEGEASSLLHLGDAQLAEGLSRRGPAQLGAGARAAGRDPRRGRERGDVPPRLPGRRRLAGC